MYGLKKTRKKYQLSFQLNKGVILELCHLLN